MSLAKLALFLSLAFFLFLSPVLAQSFPAPLGLTSDFAGIFSSEYTQNLNQRLEDIKEETSAEIAVVTIKSLEDYSVEEYAVKLFEAWGIGLKGKDNGLLLLIAPVEHQVRLEVGYGLEPVITDGRAGDIIRASLTPNFKNNDYEAGVSEAIDQIYLYLISPENQAENSVSTSSSASTFSPLLPFLFIFLVYLFAYLSRTREFITGGIVGLLLGLFLGGFFTGLFLFLLGLFLDFILSKNYKTLKKKNLPTNFLSTFGGFKSTGSGRSGGSSGFGGFSSGRSGGGGASGSW